MLGWHRTCHCSERHKLNDYTLKTKMSITIIEKEKSAILATSPQNVRRKRTYI
jgi:hypothetical protein